MSATRNPPKSLPIPDVREAAKTNRKVDVEQVEKAQALLEELRKGGRRQRGYDIASPYVRKPLRRGRRSGLGTPYG